MSNEGSDESPYIVNNTFSENFIILLPIVCFEGFRLKFRLNIFNENVFISHFGVSSAVMVLIVFYTIN